MTPQLVTDVAAEDEPITLELAWTHLSIDVDGSPPSSAFDTWLESVGIPAAREAAERFTGRAFGIKTYRMESTSFPDEIEIPIIPLLSVDAIEYTDADGVAQTLGTGDFEVDDSGTFPVVVPTDSWPETDGSVGAFAIEFTVGYATDAVPRQALLGMLLTLGHIFKNREAVTDRQAFELPVGLDYLLRPLRVRLGMA